MFLPQGHMGPRTRPATCPTTLTEGKQEPQPMSWQQPRVSGVRTGRRRWGQASFSSGDSWENGEDAVSEDKGAGQAQLFPESTNSIGATLQSKSGLNRSDSTTQSAKQHYLHQSRYLPVSQNTKGGEISECREEHFSKVP
ncbi:serine/threonine-protein kinase MAK-like [Pungitius pungitius]|uniref:serine/threonine-protein kinase MAK-like n=1 Tax=Pungitius pungitius TaxID=134920 RepID=UPI002E11F010